MKKTLVIALALATLCAASSAFAENSEQKQCADWIVAGVADQAQHDLATTNFVVKRPDMSGWDGGEVLDFDVQVLDSKDSSKVLAVYDVTIDETCTLIHSPEREN